MKKFAKILVFGLACLATLIFVAYQFENFRGWRAWKNYKAKVERTGENLDSTLIIPPPVPDASNFAAIPYFLERFKTNGNRSQRREPLAEFTDALGRAEEPSTISNSFVFHHIHMAKLLAALRKSYDTNATAEPMTAEQKAFIRRYGLEMNPVNATLMLDTNLPPSKAAQAVLVELHDRFDSITRQIEEAAHRPFSRYPIDYQTEPTFAVLLPHLATLRSDTLLFKTRAIAELQTGQGELALKDVRLMFRLADSIENEPTLISYLVRVAALNQCLEAIAIGLSSGAWNDSQIADIETSLLRINSFGELSHAMHAERVYFGLKSLDYLRRGPPGNAESLGVPALLPRALPDGWFYLEMLNYHQLATTIDGAYSPDEKTINPERAKSVEARFEKEFSASAVKSLLVKHNWFSRMLLPALTRVSLRAAKTQTGINLAAVACALERYHMANGRYPEKLEDLGPLLPQVPSDPIRGTPLHYRLEPPAYVLYSVGWNEQDENGYVDKKQKGQGESLDGDWAWRPLPAASKDNTNSAGK